jgi:chromosome segregation ATPase
MSAPDFLTNFEGLIDRLNTANGLVEASLQQKQTFSRNLLTGLESINRRLNELGTKIKNTLQVIERLEGAVKDNDTTSANNGAEIDRLNKEIADLRQERDRLIAAAEEAQKTCDQEKAALQEQIDDCRREIASLGVENSNLLLEKDAEIEALRKELEAKGGDQAAHAAAIAELTEKYDTLLKDQQDGLTEQIGALQTQIDDCKEAMRKLEEEKNAAIAQVAGKDAEIEGLNKQVEDLTAQINRLQTENTNMIELIKRATEVMNLANDNLNKLINSVPNDATSEEMQKAFEQIGNLIAELDQMLAGVLPAQLPERQPQRRPLLPGDMKVDAVFPEGVPQGMPADIVLQDIYNQINEKLRSVGPSAKAKYNKLRTDFENASSPEEMKRVLLGVYKNGQIMGGKKTKKNRRKQKGGFIINETKKRKRLTTITSSPRSSSAYSFRTNTRKRRNNKTKRTTRSSRRSSTK